MVGAETQFLTWANEQHRSSSAVRQVLMVAGPISRSEQVVFFASHCGTLAMS